MWTWASWICYFFMVKSVFSQETTVKIADRIAAVVDQQLITISDIRLERDVASMSPSIFLPFTQRRKKPFRFLLEIHVLKHLAGKVPLYQPDPKLLKKRLHDLSNDWFANQHQDLRKLHAADEARLRSFLSTLMIAEKYAQRNMGSSRLDSGTQLQNQYDKWIEGLLINAQRNGVLRLIQRENRKKNSD